MTLKRFIVGGLAAGMGLVFSSPILSEERHYPFRIDTDYTGNFQESYEELRLRIPGMVNSTQREIMRRLGLKYHEGFRYPLTISFVDMKPSSNESMKAYVKIKAYINMKADLFLGQLHMSINLYSYTNTPQDFDRVFKHEMTHVVMADTVGPGAYVNVPDWFNEGVAMWASGQGDAEVRADVLSNMGRAEAAILGPLEGREQARLYSQYFLAVHYIVHIHGPDGLEKIIRDIARRKPFMEALTVCTGQNWGSFKTHVRDYSVGVIKKIEDEGGVRVPDLSD